jgi:heme/copper-type cytochrome/quinol oxidase subunit 2
MFLKYYLKQDPSTYYNYSRLRYDVYTKPPDWSDAMKDLWDVFTTMVMGILVATPIIALLTIVALKAP